MGKHTHRDARQLKITKLAVLGEISQEAYDSEVEHGVQHLPDGTKEFYRGQANLARSHCMIASRKGTVTWRHIAVEEFYEALTETEWDKLRVELVQTAAVIVKWILDGDRRERES